MIHCIICVHENIFSVCDLQSEPFGIISLTKFENEGRQDSPLERTFTECPESFEPPIPNLHYYYYSLLFSDLSFIAFFKKNLFLPN